MEKSFSGLSRLAIADWFLILLPALLLFSRAVADVTVLISGLVFLYISFKNRQWDWAKTTWFRFLLVFVAYLLVVNTSVSVEPAKTFVHSLAFMRWPLFAIALAFFYLKTPEQKQLFIKALLLTSAFIVLDTYWQYLFELDWFGIDKLNADRLTGPFRKPVPGTFMLRVWFIMAFAAFLWPGLHRSHTQQLSFLGGFLLLGLAFIFITGERMAFMLFSLGILACIVGVIADHPSYKKQALFGFSVAILLFIGLTQLVPQTTERTVWSIFEKLNHFGDSDYGRVFHAAYAAWQQTPVFGSGMHTYREVCERMGVLEQLGMICTHPHNLYLQLAAETGVVGMSLFVLMLISLYRYVLAPVLQSRHYLIAGLCFAILTASFWPLTGGISVLSNWVAALIWLGVGWCLAISDTFRQSPSAEEVLPDP